MPAQQRRAAQTATFALLASHAYSLPTLIRNAGIKPKPFRRIQPTEALRSSIAAPYFDLVRAWQAERGMLLAAYSSVLPDRGSPLAGDATAVLQRHIDASAGRIAGQVAVLKRRFTPALANMDRWHRAQWNARIKAATTLDVSMFGSTRDTASVQSNAAVQNGQLLDQVHTETRSKIATALLLALSVRAPVSSVAVDYNDLMGRVKARAARIGVDQADRVSGEMDRARAASAGLARFTWRHTPQKNPRPENLARNGKVFSQGNAPNDRAGTLPFCKCWEEWLLG